MPISELDYEKKSLNTRFNDLFKLRVRVPDKMKFVWALGRRPGLCKVCRPGPSLPDPSKGDPPAAVSAHAVTQLRWWLRRTVPRWQGMGELLGLAILPKHGSSNQRLGRRNEESEALRAIPHKQAPNCISCCWMHRGVFA